MKKWDYVKYYNNSCGEVEKGRVKSIDYKKWVVFVVYKCNEDWDNYENYTWQSTKIIDIITTKKLLYYIDEWDIDNSASSALAEALEKYIKEEEVEAKVAWKIFNYFKTYYW